MPVIKNILRKAKNSFQGLKNVDVFIEDTDPNSKYFNIFDLPEELPLGCSSFLIEGSELLKKEVNLKIELLDSQNNVVFTTPVDNYLEDKSRRVSIEIYEDVAAGVATLTILGELDPNKTSVPQGFRDVYNVRFNKRININKTKENDRPIRFYGPPTISVSEIVKGVIEETTGGTNQTSTITGTIGLNVTTNKVLDTEVDVVLPTNNVDDLGEDDFISSQTPKSKKTTTFNSKIGKKGNKKKKQKKFKTTYSITGNVVAMGAGTNNSTNKITSDFVGATITISNPHQLVDTEKFPTTRYSLPTTYSTTISEVVNETTFKVKAPYYVTDDTTKRIPVSLKSATNNVSITYDSYVEETESSIFKRSYADITIGNLRTFSGDVYKAKIFTRDSNTPTDFEKIYDAFVEPPNILIDETSATGFTNIGFFHQQSDINNNWVSSSIGNSTGTFATQNNQYLVDGLLLSGSNETFGNLVEFRTKNSFDLEKDVDYVVKFDSYFFKETAEYKSDQDTISTEKRADLKVFLSGSGLTGNEGEEDYYLGKVEIPTNSNDEGEISSVIGSFRSAGSGSPKAWLKFKLNSGQFIIKDVSIEPFSEENFNPNYFRTIVPMPGLVNVKRDRLFDFRAEFYDVNNNEAGVGATIERVNFDGVPTIVQGLDNKITGSVMVGESVEIYGSNPAYLRSVGYQGFAHTTANNKGGFMMFSGSIGSGAAGGNRITASEAYDGVGLEIVDAHDSDNHRFLKFRTNPSEFTVQTDQFFLGKEGQFISGSNGNIVISSSNFFLGGENTFVSGANDNLEISSSNFHLDNDGSVIMQGTITAQAGGQIGGFTIGSASMFSGADEVDTTFFLSGSGHSGAHFVNSNLVISSSGFQVNSTGAISASDGQIAEWNISGNNLQSTGGGGIRLNGNGNSAEISINSHTFGNEGIQLGYNSGAPRFYAGNGGQNFLRYDTSNGVDIKTIKFELDTPTLEISSTEASMSLGSSQEIVIRGNSNSPYISIQPSLALPDKAYGDTGIMLAVAGGSTPLFSAVGSGGHIKFNGTGIDLASDTFELDASNLEISSTQASMSLGEGKVLLKGGSTSFMTLGSGARTISASADGTDTFISMGAKGTFTQFDQSTQGVIMGIDDDVSKFEVVGNATNYISFNGTGLDIKSTTFDLDATTLIMDSATNSGVIKLGASGGPGSATGTTNGGAYIDGTGKFNFVGDANNFIRFNSSGLEINTAKFDVNTSGEITATGGTIAGWTLGNTTIQGGNLVLNKEGTIESADFSSGNIAGSGKGFRLSALDNGFLEVENARIRGTLSTAVFEKETVNAVGGQLLIGNSTTITGSGGFTGVTASSATMSVENVTGFTGSYNGFNTAGAVSNIDAVDGEILILKKVDNTGFSTEYVCVNSASRNAPSDDNNLSGLLYVTRSFGLGTGTLGAGPGSNFTGSVGEGAKNYEDGQVIVSTGRYISGTGDSTTGTGYINLNARPTDTATPYIDIVERTGSKVYEMDLKARLGDLSGISTAKVGSSPGFGLFTDRAFLTKDVTVGTLSGEHVLISGSYLAFKNNNTIMAQLEGTTWTLGGQTGTTTDAIKIAPGGVFIYDNSDDYVKVTSDGLNVYESGNNVATFGANSTITGGSITLQGTTGTTGDEKLVIENNSISMFTEGNEVFDVTGAVMTIGSSTDKVTINGTSGITIRENDADTISMVNGVVTVGSSTDKVTINGTSGITIRENNSDTIQMINGVVTIGSSTDQVEINGTSGITIRENNKDNITLTNGTMKLGVDENNGAFAQLDGSTLDFITDSSGTNTTRASIGATTTIGDTDHEHVRISGSGFELKDGSTQYIGVNAGGMSIGDDITISTAGASSLSIGNLANVTDVGDTSTGFLVDSSGNVLIKQGAANKNYMQFNGGVIDLQSDTFNLVTTGSGAGEDGGLIVNSAQPLIMVSGSRGSVTGNSVRLLGDEGVLEVSQSGAGVFDTGRTKTFTTNTFIEPAVFKSGGVSKGYVSSSTSTEQAAPRMDNLDVGNIAASGLIDTNAIFIDTARTSTPFAMVNDISRTNAATNPDGVTNPTASFAVNHSVNYTANTQNSNCHPAFTFNADYFTELAESDTNDTLGWVQNSVPSGSNIFTISTTARDVDNTDFEDAKFNILGLESNTSGLHLDRQNEYTFLQAKHSGSVRLQIQHDGDVVSKGNLTAFGTTFLTVSDEREKKDIYQISESLDKVLELRPTKFTWRETNKQDVGFIAQEVEEVIPEVVETSRGFINTDDSKERKTIAYPKLVPYLVDTIQELTKRIEELEKKVK